MMYDGGKLLAGAKMRKRKKSKHAEGAKIQRWEYKVVEYWKDERIVEDVKSEIKEMESAGWQLEQVHERMQHRGRDKEKGDRGRLAKKFKYYFKRPIDR